jgi:RTA1 like protein
MGLSAVCLPTSDKDNQWKYCPNVPVAVVFFVLFLLITLFHVYQAIRWRKLFALVIILGALMETLSFASRVASAHKPTEKGIYDASFLLLILAPLSVNAFDYMVLGRMTRMFIGDQKLLKIRAGCMGKLFVGFDIMSV